MRVSPYVAPGGTAGPQACAARLGDAQRPTITKSFSRWPPGLRDTTTMANANQTLVIGLLKMVPQDINGTRQFTLSYQKPCPIHVYDRGKP